MWCKEIAQPIRDESYSHLQPKPVRDEVDQITNIRATVSIKRSAVKPCVKDTEQSHVASLLEMKQEGLGDTRNSLGLAHKLFYAAVPFL